MRAIILAAGLGLRLQQPVGEQFPKCLLRFDGVTLLERHLQMLDAAGVDDVVLALGFLQSLSHVNARLNFGWLGERIFVSPSFHRAHHGILAAGQRSCNYGSVFSLWDQLFGTADFNRAYAPTGDPSANEKLATGNYLEQQWMGLRRFAATIARA